MAGPEVAEEAAPPPQAPARRAGRTRGGVWRKVLGVALVPVLALAGGAAYVGVTALSDAATARDLARVLSEENAQTMFQLGQALEAERRTSALHAEGRAAPEDRADTRLSTDGLLGSLRDAIGGPEDHDALVLGVSQLETLPVLLASARSVEDAAGPHEVYAAYTAVITGYGRIITALSADVADAGLSARLRVIALAAELDGTVVEAVDAVVAGVWSAQAGGPADVVGSARGRLAVTDAKIRELAGLLPDVASGVPPLPDDAMAALAAAAAGEALPEDTPSALALTTQYRETLGAARQAELAGLVAQADEIADGADVVLLVVSGVAVGVLLLTAALAVVMSRRVGRPLAALADAADLVRDHLGALGESADGAVVAPPDLPQVAVSGTDEVARVAAAINTLNDTTVRVTSALVAARSAAAESFVNIARRSQRLLVRQLAVLDQLERSEENPAVVAQLFSVDHLATRMHRQAESLLVLAGVESARRVRDPMPVSDVIRSAASQVEDYERVEITAEVDPAVHGRVAMPAAHLVAEVLENALQSSDPAVPVHARVVTHEAGVVVSVTDSGIGISARKLELIGEALHAPLASQGQVSSEGLGIGVISRLARRLGVQVRYQSQEGVGTTVSVLLPDAVLAGREDRAVPPPPATVSSPPPGPPVPPAAEVPLGAVPPVGAPSIDLAGAAPWAPVVGETEPVTPPPSGRRVPKRPAGGSVLPSRGRRTTSRPHAAEPPVASGATGQVFQPLPSAPLPGTPSGEHAAVPVAAPGGFAPPPVASFGGPPAATAPTPAFGAPAPAGAGPFGLPPAGGAPGAAAPAAPVVPAVPAPGGAVEEVRRRNALASAALAELSHMSRYVPEQAGSGAPALSRRAPAASDSPPGGGATPGAPEPVAASQPKDPDQVRSMLSGMQRGLTRARRSVSSATDGSGPAPAAGTPPTDGPTGGPQ
ncbi:ATP-binding protein [Cellulomonas triticagri]|uniref:histidine kinase n=1 Tax=Cellulomonas triticagri TaxID=2483352 RepID=A0A3M2JKV0_9CELL|nr:ATP-binding protein [Cellulomonas triticagri]RMI12836.1 HAMP domain-containing protein [Cellulomonas triticagri]